MAQIVRDRVSLGPIGGQCNIGLTSLSRQIFGTGLIPGKLRAVLSTLRLLPNRINPT